MIVISAEKTIVLSRTNLLSLLAKLDGHPPDSKCSLSQGGWRVRAEADEIHYANGKKQTKLHTSTAAAVANLKNDAGLQ